jgi:predicted RNA-binding protein YlxR (DUF448 family)
MTHTGRKKPPLRTCVGCRGGADKRDLVRVVRTKDGDVFVDPSGRAAGRGAYVCPRTDCFELAAADRLGAALRARLDEEDVERLRHEFEAALEAASVEGR